MTAKVYRLPARYPKDDEGISLYRSGDGWVLRRMQCGHAVEIRGLSTDELRDIHEMSALALQIH